MSQDFYQAEFAKPTEIPTVGLFRDGRHLVVDLVDHQFPDRCVKTDVPISGAHSLIKLATYNVPADELNLVRGVVVASTNQLPHIKENNKGNSVIVQLGVPLTAAQAKRLKSPWSLVTAIGFLVWTIACFAGLYLFNAPNQIPIFLGLLLGVLVGIIGMIVGLILMVNRTTRVLSVLRLADRKVWLKGVHPAWLARLPTYTASVELLQRDWQRAKSSEWWSFGTAILFGIAALVCIPLAINGYFHGMSSETWPETQGAIQRVEVNAHRSKSHRWWTVDFDFDYSVEGKHYTGRGSQREESEWDAQNNAKQKPAGTPVTVFYHPQQHDDNRIERGLSGGEIIWMVAAVIVSLIAVIAAMYGLMARVRKAGLQAQLDERQRLPTHV